MRLSLFVAMTPTPKARPRVRRDGHAYTPEATVTAENTIRVAWLAEHRYVGLAAWGNGEPVRLTVTVWLRRPASSKRPLPSRRPDLDNYIKIVDALNGVCWRDDGQVTSLEAAKRYCVVDQPEGIEITVETDPALASLPMVDGERAVIVTKTSYRGKGKEG